MMMEGSPFTHAQAQAFIGSLGAAHPDKPGDWFQFALVEGATGEHLGDVAPGLGTHEPRPATIRVTLATSAEGRGHGGVRRSSGYSTTCSRGARSTV
jgi:hypothetical protein